MSGNDNNRAPLLGRLDEPGNTSAGGNASGNSGNYGSAGSRASIANSDAGSTLSTSSMRSVTSQQREPCQQRTVNNTTHNTTYIWESDSSKDSGNNCIKISFGIACLLATAAAVGVALKYTVFAAHDDSSSSSTPTPNPNGPTPMPTSSTVTWDYDVPYAGGGTLIFNNMGDEEITIFAIAWLTNVLINWKKLGSVYGELAPWNQTKVEISEKLGDFSRVQVIEQNEGVKIPAKSAANFTFVFGENGQTTTNGPIPKVGLLPREVQLNINGNTQNIELAGKCKGGACRNPFYPQKMGGYFTNWYRYTRGTTVKDLQKLIDAGDINKVSLAFLEFDKDTGAIKSSDFNADNFDIPRLQKANERKQDENNDALEVNLAFGGADSVADFTALMKSSTASSAFIKNAANLLGPEGTNFDGITIDLEPMGQVDPDLFLGFLKDLRAALPAGKTIVIAGPAGVKDINRIGDKWAEIAAVVDGIDVMAYDFTGGWGGFSGPQSAFAVAADDPNGADNSMIGAAAAYDKYNVPANKIIWGSPTYFRGTVVEDVNNDDGYGQPVKGNPPGQFVKLTKENTGVYDDDCVLNGNCHQDKQGSALPGELLPIADAPHGNTTKTPWFKSPELKSVFSGDSLDTVVWKMCFMLGKLPGFSNEYLGSFLWAFGGDGKDMPKSQKMAEVMRDQSVCSKLQAAGMFASGNIEPQQSNPEQKQDVVVKVGVDDVREALHKRVAPRSTSTLIAATR